MTRGAGLLQYQRAFSKAKGKPTMIVPSSGLKKDKKVAIRDAHPDVVKQKSEKKEIRDVMDLMRAVNGFAFLICACGLKIKVPPDFDEPKIDCPRCKRENRIPTAQVTDMAEAAAVIGAMVGATSEGDQDAIPTAQEPLRGGARDSSTPLVYHRKSNGWETFNCSCGKLQQLSPAFSAHQLHCRACGRVIKVDPA
jgi:heat shock protein HtpX